MSSRILVVYFSRAGYNYYGGSIVKLPVGNTEIAAGIVAKLTGGDLFKLEPVKQYPEDYHACTEAAQQELRDGARPELKALPDLRGYDTLVIAYPSWWGTLPMPVWTFLEQAGCSGQTLLPLCTHEGSGLGRSQSDLKKLCPQAAIQAGLAIQGSRVKDSEPEIQAWLRRSRLIS